ncbi:MAG TPA: PIN domain-containing protein [Terracidiphilus sp.]|nr:PIN domain-containing protein [Terracidiphilus sp.]
MRLVLDTDVVVAAMRSPRGASAELLRRIDAGQAVMLLTVALALEYEAKCMLAEHRLASGLSARDAGLFVDGLIGMAVPVKSFFRWRPQLHDPGDELVLEAAVNGQADTIVTFNERHLREARTGFGIEVIRPGVALRRIEK